MVGIGQTQHSREMSQTPTTWGSRYGYDVAAEKSSRICSKRGIRRPFGLTTSRSSAHCWKGRRASHEGWRRALARLSKQKYGSPAIASRASPLLFEVMRNSRSLPFSFSLWPTGQQPLFAHFHDAAQAFVGRHAPCLPSHRPRFPTRLHGDSFVLHVWAWRFGSTERIRICLKKSKREIA